MGIEPTDVSKMAKEHFRRFSVERLQRFLVALDQDVEIVARLLRAGTKAATRITITTR